MNLFGSDTRPWVTAVAGAGFLGLLTLLLLGGYAAVMRRRTGRPVPEANLRIWTDLYSATSIRRYLTDAGEGGWHAYRLQLGWDIAYAVLLGVAGVVLLDGVLGRAFDDRWWLVAAIFVPALAAAADVGEDLLLLAAVGDPGPDPDPPLPRGTLLPWARWCTRGKFVLHGLSAVLLVIGAIQLLRLGPAG